MVKGKSLLDARYNNLPEDPDDLRKPRLLLSKVHKLQKEQNLCFFLFSGDGLEVAIWEQPTGATASTEADSGV
jgi:hypothetical protein